MKTPAEIAEEIVYRFPGHDVIVPPKASQELREAITAAIQARDEEHSSDVERLKGYLERANWRHCDIPACNCNGYHNWNPKREDIEEPLRGEIDALKAELEAARGVVRSLLTDLGGKSVETSGMLTGRAWLERNKEAKPISTNPNQEEK